MPDFVTAEAIKNSGHQFGLESRIRKEREVRNNQRPSLRIERSRSGFGENDVNVLFAQQLEKQGLFGEHVASPL